MIRRVCDALNGLKNLLLDKSFRLHLFGVLLAVLYGFIIKLSLTQFLWIIMCIALVLISEGFNCTIEKLCDLYSTNYHPLIKIIKDMSAAAVIMAAIFASIIALVLLYIQYQGGII